MILHVGTLSSRKNVTLLVEAFKKANRTDYKLVMCGGEDLNLASDRTKGKDANIDYLTAASDQELKGLYARASYFISASHYEGFGLPVLEAIANGATPILSDIPVYRELYRDDSLFFNPKSENELVTIISQLPATHLGGEMKCKKLYEQKFDYKSSAERILKMTLES